MHLHRNAKTTPKGRALIVQRVEGDGWTVAATASAFGVSMRTVYKWRRRQRRSWRESIRSQPAATPRLPGALP